MRKHPNSHREAKATAPVLDSTRWHAYKNTLVLKEDKRFATGEKLILPELARLVHSRLGFRRQRLELLGRNNSSSLEDGVEIVPRQVLDGVDRARGPANFQAVDLHR
jgi:hypothetical protein